MESSNFCNHCKNERCVVKFFGEDWKIAESIFGYKGYQDIQDVPNNARRKQMYRIIAIQLNEGPMGKGVRMKLPFCCVEYVREAFPKKNEEEYIGHKDT